jgi:hypothetical protein
MRNISDEIAAAEAALADAEARIAQLEAERVAMLEQDTDYVVTASKIAREIETLRETAEAHRARIAALAEKERKADRDERERQRVTAIAAIKRKLPARQAGAAKLDRALALVAEAVAELEAADKAVFANWPDVLPPAHSLRYTSTLTGAALSTARVERPRGPGVIRALLEKMSTLDFAAEAAKCNTELVAELERTPLVEREEAAA